MAKAQKVKGDALIEALLGLTAGEQVLVGTAQWTSLDDLQFEVVEDFGDGKARFVTLDDDQDEIDSDAVYDFQR